MATTEAEARVVLPSAHLAQSPSRADGIDAEVERAHRFWGCELIQEAGILLRLPQVVMVTAQTMLQRFYYRKSLRDFDAFRVALGCLFLAAKVEEKPKRIKEVLTVFYAIYRRRKWQRTTLAGQCLDLESDSYYLWRDWLVLVERQILIDLGFSLYNIMEHPHKYILYYIKILDGPKALAQRAWGYLNDSLRIDLCVRFKAEVIACAAIFLSARMLQIKLPDQPPWYELFDVSVTELIEAAKAIMGLYTWQRRAWIDPLTEVDPFAVDDLPEEPPVTVSAPTTVTEPTTATTTRLPPEVEALDSDNPPATAAPPIQAQTPEDSKLHLRGDVADTRPRRRERGRSRSRDRRDHSTRRRIPSPSSSEDRDDRRRRRDRGRGRRSRSPSRSRSRSRVRSRREPPRNRDRPRSHRSRSRSRNPTSPRHRSRSRR